MKRKLIFAKFT